MLGTIVLVAALFTIFVAGCLALSMESERPRHPVDEQLAEQIRRELHPEAAPGFIRNRRAETRRAVDPLGVFAAAPAGPVRTILGDD